MNLLIVTQKVDADDPILGFFHRWIEELAGHFDRVIVICLYEGGHELPNNVEVHSLGKEKEWPRGPRLPAGGAGCVAERARHAIRFCRLAWRLRRRYDAVFVHMNQEYVLLGGLLWKVLGKKVCLWRNHREGDWRTRLAVIMSDAVFYTSPQSFTARFKKGRIMPVGVDLELFRLHPEMERKPGSMLFLGRISPVKKVDAFVDMLEAMRKRGVPFTATIVGDPTDRDAAYYERVKKMVADYGLGGVVAMKPAVRHGDTVRYYCSHETYVNLTEGGSMDKTILEAAACGAKVIASNPAVKDGVDPEKHGLKRLAESLANEISN